MLGRMAEAGDHAPLPTADAHILAILHAVVGRRYRRHQRRVIILASAQLRQQVRVAQAVALKVRQARGTVDAGQRGRHHARKCVLAGGHPQRRLPARAQPIGQADMVGMAMGRDHAYHRQAAQLAREDGFPGSTRGVVGDAAIDDGPAADRPAHRVGCAFEFILQQPQVDVVQRERQAHAQPPHTGRDFMHHGGFRQGIAEWIIELGFKRIHQVSRKFKNCGKELSEAYSVPN